jgi:antitoxin (DNA-binding transcriptional repressor) of toxin-antitoxin stability system
MKKVNINDAKTHLSHYLDQVEKGERIILCRRNRPVAEVRAIPAPLRQRRPIGLAKGRFSLPASFFEPLPDEISGLFNGEFE